jgi:hypothetical protein
LPPQQTSQSNPTDFASLAAMPWEPHDPDWRDASLRIVLDSVTVHLCDASSSTPRSLPWRAGAGRRETSTSREHDAGLGQHQQRSDRRTHRGDSSSGARGEAGSLLEHTIDFAQIQGADELRQSLLVLAPHAFFASRCAANGAIFAAATTNYFALRISEICGLILGEPVAAPL